MDALMELIGAVRTLRSEYNVPAGSHVRVAAEQSGAALREALAWRSARCDGWRASRSR
jgi:hypothetical protein